MAQTFTRMDESTAEQWAVIGQETSDHQDRVADRVLGMLEPLADNTDGFDVDFGDLGFAGERNDVVAYLADRGWQSTRTPVQRLLTEAGLPPIPRVDGAIAIGDKPPEDVNTIIAVPSSRILRPVTAQGT